MDQFVCVRLVKCNHLDLTLFQFDYDLTFGVTFLNADRTIYGRYGTRTSMTNAERDVSLEGLAATLKSVLAIHSDYRNLRPRLAGKQAAETEQKKPEDFAELKKYAAKLDYQGQVARGCIHCHQVGDAQRNEMRRRGKPLPEQLMFPYPAPQTVGLKIDPKTASSILDVIADSAADRSGLKAGDKIVSINDQPIVSTADVQWILHRSQATDQLAVTAERDGETVSATIQLESGWRETSDISWRPTSWNLRRLATGGIRFESLAESRRKKLGIADDQMALLAQHVALYGQHAIAHRAGIKKGDVIVSIDGKTDFKNETDVLRYSMQTKKSGDSMTLALIRGNKRFEVRFRLP